MTLNRKTLLRRILGEELVSYAVFAVDKTTKQSMFFALEEVVPSEFYVNPRNTMFQLRYMPKLSSTPLGYYDFCQELINSTIAALQKSIAKTQSEVLALQALKHTLLEIHSTGL